MSVTDGIGQTPCSVEHLFGMLSRRADWSASAGLSCSFLLFSKCHCAVKWRDKQ